MQEPSVRRASRLSRPKQSQRATKGVDERRRSLGTLTLDASSVVQRAVAVLITPGAVLSVLLTANAAVGIWWIGHWRVGWPFDIDEAGYLQMALSDGLRIASGHPSSMIALIHTSNPQAPLLPAFAGLVWAATHLTAAWLIASLQVFLVLAAVATYICARRSMNSWWAVLAAAVVAVTPGLVWASRSFYFALPAAALLMSAIAAQLWAAQFEKLGPSIAWGILMGLAALARSMIIGLLPGLVLAATLRVLVGRRNRAARFLNEAIGLTVGVLVAGIWYSASWRNVLDYLTSYGYGKNAAAYGRNHPLLSWSWWTFRLDNIVQSDLFLPITLAVGLSLVCGAFVMLWRALKGKRPSSRSNAAQRLVRFAVSDLGSLVIVFAWGYLILTSTRNVGSGFEIPLIPPGIVLTVSVAANLPRIARVASAFALCAAAVVAFADQATLLPGGTYDKTVITFSALSIPAFDARGVLISYASDFVAGGCPALVMCSPGHASVGAKPLKGWNSAAKRMASLLERDAAAHHHRLPVVFFAMQDPFFNTNTVALAAQEMYRSVPPIGLLRPPSQVHMSFTHQLNDPSLGEPDVVITGPPPPTAAARAFSPLPEDRGAIVALTKDGFVRDGSVVLPDGRRMTVWWKQGRGKETTISTRR